MPILDEIYADAQRYQQLKEQQAEQRLQLQQNLEAIALRLKYLPGRFAYGALTQLEQRPLGATEGPDVVAGFNFMKLLLHSQLTDAHRRLLTRQLTRATVRQLYQQLVGE